MKLNPRLFACAALFAAALPLPAQSIREISFTTASPAANAPVLDGRLDDACWKAAVPNTAYFEYFKGDPKRVDMPTECSVVYDAQGVYVGICNFESDSTKIKRNIRKNHEGRLWTDDCAEIYLDPKACGTAYYKFVVNALGKYDDAWRMDTANYYANWNGDGIQAAADIAADRWTLELFVPWANFQQPAANPGDVWMFNHCRYAMGRGKLIVSSPGGSYMSPEKFGYLYFSDGKQPDRQRIGEIIAARLKVPWGLSLGEEIMFHESGRITYARIEDRKNDEIRAFQDTVAEADGLLAANPRSDLVRRLAAATNAFHAAVTNYDGTFSGVKGLIAGQSAAQSVVWELKTDQILAGVPAKPVAFPGARRWEKPAVHDGYNGWYMHNFSTNYATPHLRWAGSPADTFRLLYVAPGDGWVRHGIEWVQRFHVAWDIFVTANAGAFGTTGPYADKVSGYSPAEKDEQFIVKLGDNPDLFVFEQFRLGSLRGDFLYEILRRVRDEGKGLVVLGGGLPKTIADKLAPAGGIRALATQIPFNTQTNYYPPKVPGGPYPEPDVIVKSYALGKGRIVDVVRHRNPGWSLEWKHDFENRQAFLGRIFFDAAGIEPGAGFVFPGADADGATRLGAGATAIPVQVNFKWSPHALAQGLDALKKEFDLSHTLHYRLRNTANTVLHEADHALQPGCNDLRLAIPPAPGGKLTLDLIALRGGREVAVGTHQIVVGEPAGPLTLALQDVYRDRAPLRPVLSWGIGQSEPVELVIELFDLPYRRVWHRRVETMAPRARRWSGEIKDYPMPTLAGVFRARLLNTNGVQLAEVSRVLRFPHHRFPIYAGISWNGIDVAGIPELFAPQVVENGVWDANLGGWSGESGLFNAWTVPYITRVMVGNTPSNGVGIGMIRASKEITEKLAALGPREHLYSPETQALYNEQVGQNARDAARFGVCAYNLGDECGYSAEAGFSPADNTTYYPAFLKEKYGRIEAYNAAGGTRYARFEDVPRMTPAAAKEADNPQAWYDQIQYAEKLYADAFKILSRIIKQHDPGARVGAEGSSAGDLELTVDGLEFWGPYRNVVMDELLRNIAPDHLRGTWWGGYSSNPRDGFPQNWEYLLTGTINCDEWFTILPGDAHSAHSDDLSFLPYVEMMIDYLRDLRWGVAPQLVVAPLRRDGAVMLYSHASLRASEWDERLSSPTESMDAFIGFCYRTGLGVEFAGRKTLDRIRGASVLLLFGSSSLTPQEIDAVRAFVNDGGLAIADINPALMSACMTTNAVNPLADLFGEATYDTVPEFVLAPLDLPGFKAAKVKQRKGAPLFQRKPVGKGETILLNFTLATASETAAGKADFDAFLLKVLAERGIARRYTVGGDPLQKQILRVREGEGFDLVGLVTATQDLGKRVTLDLGGTPKFIYAVNKGPTGRGGRIEIPKLELPFSLYTLFDTEQTPPPLTLSGDALAPGEAVALDLRPLRKGCIYLLSVAAPGGGEIQDRRLILHADGKQESQDLCFAHNDAPGSYTVTLKDIATGLASKRSIRVE